ncbi:uncharacterized protein LOC126736367 [Anthonomus grandis grandis]|uniref:uncharacterized protein LOC126736367 n=1 Tax=Anthonomus grandis grandis TaxID=2921223 RepID=UPI002166029A|nr:uncharacterized protein LOC126736367 [Anthonomus grandis grandis]
MCEMYTSFMREYETLTHMSEVEYNVGNDLCFYLPHHCVEKAESTTTKLRVVFNGSQKSSTNISLNDVLKVGATVQPDLCSILLKFRHHDYALTGDLTKMYRQINVHPEHRNLQRILWREDPSLPVKEFCLNTVTYGLASSSFLATRCLKQISDDIRTNYPIESDFIGSNFYVDDFLLSHPSLESLIQVKNNITKILSGYGFEIRKFKSNDSRVFLEGNDDYSLSEYVISDENTTKTLGISWIPTSDCFIYKLQLEDSLTNSVTKRSILSFISKIYDPLGFLGPIIIRAKLIIQQLWKLQLSWDENLPIELHSQWCEYKKQLFNINTIQIPRQVLIKGANLVELHGFSDSSESAYGCSVYLRSINNVGAIDCRLYFAKTRVAPVQAISIPRLELQAAVLLARLVSKCLSTISFEIQNIYLWTDSTIVLAWLSREPKTWQTFICNRVSEIQQLTNITDWNHISTHENPADILSRGSQTNDFLSNSLYWNGPSFLRQDKENWPEATNISYFSKNPVDVPEFKNQNMNFLCQTDNLFNFDELFSKFSSFSQLIRVAAYVFRFIDRSKGRHDVQTFINNVVSNSEFSKTSLRLIKLIQSSEFNADICHLRTHREVLKRSKLKALAPFLDPDGILRVGGRLKFSDLNYDQKHQILLPKKHKFTSLLIHSEHLRALHAGNQGTLSHIRQNYWIIDGKMAVKSCIRNCIKCFRANPPNLTYKMGDLPSVRVKPSKVFLSVGIDYAGPFNLKDGQTKTRKIIKCYVAIFVCMATKALHIDLVTDLSTDAFLNLLKRFVSRRGLCTDIYSDNATAFVGADNELKRLQNIVNGGVLRDYLNQTQINWHFIPARSPTFGGLWESAVKSCKHHLKRVLHNDHPLNFEEMYTLLVQVEAVLNSRPLISLSPDPNDLEALTPAHFIIGQPMTALPQRNLEDSHTNLVKRLLHVQKLFQQFWRRWSHDYLHTLQERSKWRFNKDPNLQIGALVIVKEENTPPAYWTLGRISAVHPGADGLVRVVTIKTKNGFLKRATTKVSLSKAAGCSDYECTLNFISFKVQSY